MTIDEGVLSSAPNALFRAIGRNEWDDVLRQAANGFREADPSLWGDVEVRSGCRPTRLLPIHYACARRAPGRVIRAFLEFDPTMGRISDRKGRIPLHWAADSVAEEAVRELLLLGGNDQVKIKEDNYGFIPLTVACYEKASPDDSDSEAEVVARGSVEERVAIVRMLAKAYPEGLTSRDHRGWMPLHHSARTGTAAVAKVLLELSPKTAAAPDNENRLPIHLVCLNKGDEEDVAAIAEALATMFPPGLSHRERKFGFLPLHTACSIPEGASTVLVNSFLRHNAHTVNEEDFFRSTPLHIATRANASYGVISSLVEAFPDAARIQDKDDRLPLHWAAHSNAPDVEVIKLLSSANPAGGRVKERKYGYTPLQVALQRDANNEEAVSYLVTQNVNALRVADKNGALPIHSVCERRTEDAAALADTMVDAYPGSVEVRDCFGRTPIDLARLRPELELKASLIVALQSRQKRRRKIPSIACVGSSVYSDSSAETNALGQSSDKKKAMALYEAAPGGLCVICLENRASLVLYPCGHICLCEDCGSGSDLRSLNHICPIGRCRFIDAVKCYGHC